MERKQANGIASCRYSIEKEANKRHSGRLINQDQSGRIEASYITSTRIIYTRPRSRVITLISHSLL